MNALIAYLDTMFSPYPQTPRLLEAKAELQGMMEDAYSGLIAEGHSENEAVGRVISDFGNLDEVAPVLGISTDIRPASSVDAASATASDAAPTPSIDRYPPVTMEEAQGYAGAQRLAVSRVSAAFTVFILSPALLILLVMSAETGLLAITEDVAIFIGVVVLLVLVVLGLGLMFATVRVTAPFTRITDGRFTPNPQVTHWAESFAERRDRALVRALTVSIGCWVLAPVPLIAFTLFLDDAPLGQFWIGIGVVVILVFVAIGLEILLRHAWPRAVADKLTGEADARKRRRR